MNLKNGVYVVIYNGLVQLVSSQNIEKHEGHIIGYWRAGVCKGALMHGWRMAGFCAQTTIAEADSIIYECGWDDDVSSTYPRLVKIRSLDTTTTAASPAQQESTKCVCSMQTLMSVGCKCGGFAKEQAARSRT